MGTWTISKINGTPPALGLDMEFTKDGHVKGMGMEVGTYKVEGDKFIITPAPGKDKKHDPETELIKKLDGTSLILFSEKNKRVKRGDTRKKRTAGCCSLTRVNPRVIALCELSSCPSSRVGVEQPETDALVV